MSQVLKFGLPIGEKLLCDSPVCELPAETIVQVARPGQEPPGEVFGCAAHLSNLLIGKRVLNVHKLKIPGQRNEAS